MSVVLPLISTEASPGGFQVKEAARIATAATTHFLSSMHRNGNEGLRVVLAAEEGSPGLEALRREQATSASGERRLVVKACALPDVAKAGAPCAFLVNPCNWRLVGRGGRTNVLVNKSAGPCLEKDSLTGRKRAHTAEPIPIKLPGESALRAEGVRTVIQVLGPNLDPRFPDCLEAQPNEARRLLRLSYDKALACFWNLACATAAAQKFPEILRGTTPGTVPEDVLEQTEAAEGSKAAAAATLSGYKRPPDSPASDDVAKRPRGYDPYRQLPKIAADIFPGYRKTSPVSACKVAGGGHWKRVLYRYLEEIPRPGALQDAVYYEDEQCLIIYDGYPKAKRHLLLIPKKEIISDALQPTQLRQKHLQALRQLHAVATTVAKRLSENGARTVRCGYHAIPSLEPLHVHIISQDLDSPCLKSKSHWNSFTTRFFLECSWVEKRLAKHESLELSRSSYEQLEQQALKCFRCKRGMSTMYALKEHNRACTAPVPPKL